MIMTVRPRRSASLIEVGDTFVFNGLVGEAQVAERVIVVTGIDILGNLQVEENTLTYTVPYPTVMQLLEEQIWQKCEIVEEQS